MSHALVISVKFHEGWYFGAGTIPSPARVFQALVAGKGLSGPLPDKAIAALEWLEQQLPPIVAAPTTKGGQAVATFVPNNDLDAKQGDPHRISEIRTKKSSRPLTFDPDVPFLFCWQIEEQRSEEIEGVCELANSVYQLGRSVDAAWAWCEVVNAEELTERLREHRGPVRYPSKKRGSVECPTPGSLASLVRRYGDMSRRYAPTSDGKGQTFRRRAKPKWRMVSYDSGAARVSLDLLDRSTSTLTPWPASIVRLVEIVRDEAARKLTDAIPERQSEIQRVLVGKSRNGESIGPSARVRIIPLPSIGHEHADQQVRRLLIEVPCSCPVSADDIFWAFSGQSLVLDEQPIDLVRSQAHRQLEHYGVEKSSSATWQSITPLALSTASRRRIEPDRRRRTVDDMKGARERWIEEERATDALRQALRHAGVNAVLTGVRLQREPFTASGQKADDFAEGTRFSRHVLWHAELQFDRSISGPIVLGDGRFLGLGLFRPI